MRCCVTRVYVILCAHLVLQLQCCGVHSPQDWARAGFAGNTLPNSCCTEIAANNPTCDTNDIKSNTEGCKAQLQRKIEENALILGGVGIGVALIQVCIQFSATKTIHYS